MKLSISAVSGKRKFTKALVKHSSKIDLLRNAAISFPTESLPFDTLQIVFLDRDETYLRPVGCKNDRIFQVEVATPDDQRTDYSCATSFLRAIAEKLLMALKTTNIAEEKKNEITSAIEAVADVK
jgi:hypothetical protein